jgi:hypothetical protein
MLSRATISLIITAWPHIMRLYRAVMKKPDGESPPTCYCREAGKMLSDLNRTQNNDNTLG